jgi:hypothetical protein
MSIRSTNHCWQMFVKELPNSSCKGDHSWRKILCWWHCVGSDCVWWLGNFCIPLCPWIFAFLLVHEFLQSSLSMNFCDIVAFLLVRCISSLCEMMMLNLSYDLCESWISVNLDTGSNCCEFSHILAGSRMQPLMAAKSWLDPGCSRQAGSRFL